MFLTVLEAGSLRSECLHGWHYKGTSPKPPGRQPSCCVSNGSQMAERAKRSVALFLFLWGHSIPTQGASTYEFCGGPNIQALALAFTFDSMVSEFVLAWPICSCMLSIFFISPCYVNHHYVKFLIWYFWYPCHIRVWLWCLFYHLRLWLIFYLAFCVT